MGKAAQKGRLFRWSPFALPLKINIKGGDSLLIADSRFTVVGDGYTTVIIEGEIPVLRESESISEREATDAPKRLCFEIQQFYLTRGPDHLERAKALASGMDDADGITHILDLLEQGQPFQALKAARKLVKDIPYA